MAVDTTDPLYINAPLPTGLIKTGGIFSLEVAVPTGVFVVDESSSAVVELLVPPPSLVIQPGAGPVALSVPPPFSLISGREDWNVLAIQVPVPQSVFTIAPTPEVLHIVVPKPTISASGNDGSADNLAIIVPVSTALLSGFDASGGSLNIRVPVPQIKIVVQGETYYCSVINTDIWEATEYTGWDFDRLFKFGGRYYGSNSTGIYLLEGDDQDGTEIDAVIETPPDDFEEITAKRVSALALGIKSDDEAEIEVLMDESSDVQRNIYVVPSSEGVRAAVKVPMGYPRQRRHIGFIFRNLLGKAFDLYKIDMDITLALRKIQKGW